jgi:hypothetical protein
LEEKRKEKKYSFDFLIEINDLLVISHVRKSGEKIGRN